MIIPNNVNGTTSALVLSYAKDYAAGGLAVIPVRADGTKAPALPKGHPVLNRQRLATAGELHDWFSTGQKGIGILGGSVSGNLEPIDFDDAEVFGTWTALVEQATLGLLDRLTLVQTPRPGMHVYYRCPEIAGPCKLAEEPEQGNNGKPRPRTLIETRGEGAYTLAPGSPASCHETGRFYQHVGGPPLTAVPQLSPHERAILLDAARSFNSWVDSMNQHASGSSKAAPGTLRPGDDFNLRASWADILKPHSWVLARQDGDVGYWRCPEKTMGWSATTGFVAAHIFYCWSENGHPFQGRHSYDKFACYAFLNHQGDFKAAARDLATQGYGNQGATSNGSSPDTSDQDDSSSKTSQGGGTIWKPVPISQLKRIALPDTFVWDGILAPGKITLLSAEAKAGKTTLTSLLYNRMGSGGSLCGAKVWPGRIIVVSEEPVDIWLDRRERLGLADHLEVLPMPFIVKPTQRDWEKMIEEALHALKQQPAALLVWDTLSHLWWVGDEHDNAKEAAALMPLRQLSATGAALALLHHFGAEKNGPRGGTELRAFPDLLAELHLYKPNDFVNKRRILKVRGRLALSPCQLVIELNETADDYQVVEGALSVGRPNLWAILTTLVPSEPPGLAATQFQQKWPTQPAPKVKKVHEALAENWQRAAWERAGTGKKNDPYRYWHPQPATE